MGNEIKKPNATLIKLMLGLLLLILLSNIGSKQGRHQQKKGNRVHDGSTLIKSRDVCIDKWRLEQQAKFFMLRMQIAICLPCCWACLLETWDDIIIVDERVELKCRRKLCVISRASKSSWPRGTACAHLGRFKWKCRPYSRVKLRGLDSQEKLRNMA